MNSKIQFTEPVKRRLIEEVKAAAEGVQGRQREIDRLDRQLKLKTRRKVKEEDKRRITRRQRELRAEIRARAEELEQPAPSLERTLYTIMRGEMYAEGVLTASAKGLFVQPKGGMRFVKTQEAATRQNS